MRDGEQPRQAIQHRSEIVAIPRRCLARVQRHADPERLQWLGPRLAKQRLLSGYRRLHCLRSGGERGLDGVADDLEGDAARGAQIASRRRVRWRSTASVMAAESICQRLVLPSMSVKRNVTVPLGRCANVGLLRRGPCGRQEELSHLKV